MATWGDFESAADLEEVADAPVKVPVEVSVEVPVVVPVEDPVAVPVELPVVVCFEPVVFAVADPLLLERYVSISKLHRQIERDGNLGHSRSSCRSLPSTSRARGA